MASICTFFTFESLYGILICILICVLSQVYGWGSSKYGQVGTGTTHIYSRPMLIETLSTAHCVDIVCGQYHTLALTAEAE